MLVMKFGGTSLGNVEAMGRTLKRIVQALNQQQSVLVVASALSEVTNQLTSLSLKKDVSLVEAIFNRHLLMAKQLVTDPVLFDQFLEDLEDFCWGLKQDLRVERVEDPQLMAKILAYGELISSTLLHYALLATGQSNGWVDVRHLILTDDHFLSAKVDFHYSLPRIKQALQQAFYGERLVITQGFIAGTKEGITTVLGREGSDYSATILASAIDADEVQIWTDAEGIMSADPKILPARLIENLTYDEASELSLLGAKIIHPLTLRPVKNLGIPVKILNSFSPLSSALKGTTIHSGLGKKFFSINYRRDVVTVRLTLQEGTLTSESWLALRQHKNEVYFFTVANEQLLVVMQKQVFEKLNFNQMKELTEGKVENNALISITIGGTDRDLRLNLLSYLEPDLVNVSVKEIYFSVSKKSILLTVIEEKVESTLRLLHQQVAKYFAH